VPACFWDLCTCPDSQPCGEHDGFRCSILDGRTITSERDIVDDLTRRLEAAAATATGDVARLDEERARLEARAAEVERERADFERALSSASSIADRREVIRKAERLQQKYERTFDELMALGRDLDALVEPSQVAIARGFAAIRDPFSDPTGYCPCYDRKLDALTLLSALIKGEQTTIGNLQALRAAFRANVAAAVKPVLSLGFVFGQITALAYVFLGLGAATFLIFVAGLVLILVLLSLLIALFKIDSELDAAIARLLRFLLAYYRVQQIPTCAQAVTPEEIEEAEKRWFERFREAIWEPTAPVPG